MDSGSSNDVPSRPVTPTETSTPHLDTTTSPPPQLSSSSGAGAGLPSPTSPSMQQQLQLPHSVGSSGSSSGSASPVGSSRSLSGTGLLDRSTSGMTSGMTSGALLHSQLAERIGSRVSPTCLSPDSRGSSLSSSSSPVPSGSPPALAATAPSMGGSANHGMVTSVSATVTAATLAAAAAAAAAAMHGKSSSVSSLLMGTDLSMSSALHSHAALHHSGHSGHHHHHQQQQQQQQHHSGSQHHQHHHHGAHHNQSSGHHHHHHHHHQHLQERGGPYGGSPPPAGMASSDPTANECKLIDYRGAKVAAFVVGGETMLCLPQAFEMFLKHLVGGLHTVYTKLKRLDITPIVCNVEQVRILRGLGAIQPGVNRCKLLSCKDFDVLYKDCTTARGRLKMASGQLEEEEEEMQGREGGGGFGSEPLSSTAVHLGCCGTDDSRPGRPPKRASLMGMSASQDTLLKLKKSRLENGEYPGFENGHIAAHLLKGLQGSIDPMMLFPLITGELRMSDKSPLLANGYNHPPTHIAPLPFMALNHHHHHHQQHQHQSGGGHGGAHSASAHAGGGSGGGLLSPGAGSLPLSSSHHAGSNRSDGSIIKERALHADQLQARLKEEKTESERQLGLDHRARDLSHYNGSSNGHSPVLNLSQKNITGGEHSGSEAALNDDDDDNISDVDEDDDKDQELSDCPDVTSTANGDRSALQQHALSYSALLGENSAGISSIETLLRNIQGLLKVAADNARQQERQINYEKAELKMEILREREVRENLEKQLVEDQRTRVLYQRRLKRERRARRRLQDQVEQEMKRRIQYEEALMSTSSEAQRTLNGTPIRIG